jgi:hypothetical protein
MELEDSGKINSLPQKFTCGFVNSSSVEQLERLKHDKCSL